MKPEFEITLLIQVEVRGEMTNLEHENTCMSFMINLSKYFFYDILIELDINHRREI